MVRKFTKLKVQEIFAYMKDNRIVIIFVLCLLLSRIHCVFFASRSEF